MLCTDLAWQHKANPHLVKPFCRLVEKSESFAVGRNSIRIAWQIPGPRCRKPGDRGAMRGTSINQLGGLKKSESELAQTGLDFFKHGLKSGLVLDGYLENPGTQRFIRICTQTTLDQFPFRHEIESIEIGMPITFIQN